MRHISFLLTWSFARPLLAATVGVVGLALVARLAFVAVYGVRLGADSYYYLGSAARLLDLGPSAIPRMDLVSAPLYPMGIALAAFLLRLDLTAAAIATQVVLGALTAAFLVRITYRLTTSWPASALAGVVGAVHPSFLFWGAYVLSETVFLFVLAVCLDRFTVLLRSRHLVQDAFVACLTVFVALLARSTAAPFALTLPVSVWFAFRNDLQRMRQAALGVGLAAALGLVIFLIAARGAPTYDVVDRVALYAWSAVYMGLEWTEQGRATGGVDLTGGPADGDRRAAVLAWVSADPAHFFLQALRKLKIFWSPVLPEFSLRHAALNLAFYVPFYVATANGIRLMRRQPADLVLILLGVASFTVTSMITFVDYDQRFRLPAELLLIPVAALGATSLGSSVSRAWRRRRAPQLATGAAVRAR